MKAIKKKTKDFFSPQKPLRRLFLLTSLKEGYLLLANAYGFLVHPQKTFRRLKHDRSQFVLFLTIGFFLFLISRLTFLLIKGVF